MAILEKLDELLAKLDTPQDLSSDEDYPQNGIIEGAETAEEGTQGESPEDAKPDETVERLGDIVLKQNDQIEALRRQIGELVNRQGVQVNDGKSSDPAHMPGNEPEPYVSLKELDFNI